MRSVHIFNPKRQKEQAKLIRYNYLSDGKIIFYSFDFNFNFVVDLCVGNEDYETANSGDAIPLF